VHEAVVALVAVVAVGRAAITVVAVT